MKTETDNSVKEQTATCDNNMLAVVFTREEILLLSISDRIRLFLMKWDNKVTFYFNMSLNDDRWRELGWGINKEEFKTDNGASFLIDKILQEIIHEKSFDFMGGSIRGIEVFFKSFGSECQEYPAIMISKKELVKNFFKK